MDILNACNWRWFCWWRPCRGNTVRRHVDWLCSICTQKNRGTRMINHCCHLKNNKRNLVIFIIFTFIEVNIGQNAITNTSIRNVYVFVYRAEFSFIMYCVMNSVCIILYVMYNVQLYNLICTIQKLNTEFVHFIKKRLR